MYVLPDKLSPWSRGALTVFANTIPYDGLEAATLVAKPPCLVTRSSCVVVGCAYVSGTIPLSRHFRVQGLPRIAYASFLA